MAPALQTGPCPMSHIQTDDWQCTAAASVTPLYERPSGHTNEGRILAWNLSNRRPLIISSSSDARVRTQQPRSMGIVGLPSCRATYHHAKPPIVMPSHLPSCRATYRHAEPPTIMPSHLSSCRATYHHAEPPIVMPSHLPSCQARRR